MTDENQEKQHMLLLLVARERSGVSPTTATLVLTQSKCHCQDKSKATIPHTPTPVTK